ncbi:type II secretion system protein N [Acinetobacter ursingii]|uniref:PDZ domain-containing protein n=1 Tax=Acinetobacter ursingii TaxID=108980 RepID=A0AA46S6X1_9GAMM|nr:type II secretion system protein N [Acinetobacter ursingii]MCU4357790.1 PDZ domain-containing protein [Acinetobacter ursingii]NOZ96338.1 PDZ domain-containing protein [Gammaproteobacteria bacterium]UYF75689.1 PDZ domain-containing protein [Acinetobacter ursingii]
MKAMFERMQQMPWHKFDKLSALVLVLLILWLCWKLASLFWWVVAPPQAMQFDRVELGSMQAQIPNITSFSLFSEPTATATNNNQSFELQGVMIGYPNRFSSAVIKVNDKAERYRVGDIIDNSAYQLSEVYWDHVILRQSNGAVQEVRFKGLENGLYQPIVPPTQTTPTTPTAPAATQGPNAMIGQAIQQMQQNRDQYLQNMGVSAANGSGYEVTDHTPSALRNTLGLRPGDRILSVNGQAVGQGQNDVQLLEQVKREGQVKIEIKRGDQVMTIQQSF